MLLANSAGVLGLCAGAAYAFYSLWAARSPLSPWSCSSAQPPPGRSDEVLLAHEISLRVANLLNDLDKRSLSDDLDKRAAFKISHGLTSGQAREMLETWGRNEIQEKAVPTRLVLFRLVCTTF